MTKEKKVLEDLLVISTNLKKPVTGFVVEYLTYCKYGFNKNVALQYMKLKYNSNFKYDN